MGGQSHRETITYIVLGIIILGALVYIYMTMNTPSPLPVSEPVAPVATPTKIVLTPAQVQVRDAIVAKVMSQNQTVTLTKAQKATRDAILMQVRN